MLPQVSNPPPTMVLVLDGAGAINPTDGSTYYMGGLSGAGVTTSNTGIRRFYIPKTGVIKSAHVYFLNPGTLGSSETSSIYIRKNNTTDYLISNAVINDAVSVHLENDALAIQVVAGDYIEIKWICPTWVTNPTSVRYMVTLTLES